MTSRRTEEDPLLKEIRILLGDIFYHQYVALCLEYALNNSEEKLQFLVERAANEICRRHPRPDTPPAIDHAMEAFPEHFGGEKTRWATSLYGQLYEELEMSWERGYSDVKSCGVIIKERMANPNYGFGDFFTAQDWRCWLEMRVCQHALDLQTQKGEHLPKEYVLAILLH